MGEGNERIEFIDNPPNAERIGMSNPDPSSIADQRDQYLQEGFQMEVYDRSVTDIARYAQRVRALKAAGIEFRVIPLETQTELWVKRGSSPAAGS